MMILVLIAALVGVAYGGGNHTCGCMQGPPGRDGRDGVPGPPGPSSPVVVELQELKKSLVTELKQMVSIQYICMYIKQPNTELADEQYLDPQSTQVLQYNTLKAFKSNFKGLTNQFLLSRLLIRIFLLLCTLLQQTKQNSKVVCTKL